MILFRINAGKYHGMGHLSRNLVLAKALKSFSIDSLFIIKSDSKEFVDSFLKNKKEKINPIYLDNLTDKKQEYRTIFKTYNSFKIKLIILDFYGHDSEYYDFLTKNKISYAQYDFECKNKISANMVINPNIGFGDYDYINLVEKKTILCVGAKYLLIQNLKKKHINKNGVKNILISLGSGEYPKKVFDLICELIKNKNYNFEIISSDKKTSNLISENVSLNYANIDVNDLYNNTDIAIVAGGVTSQELAFFRIPMLVYPFRKNHIKNAKKLIEFGFAKELSKTNFKDIVNFKPSSSITIDNLGSFRIAKKILKYIT